MKKASLINGNLVNKYQNFNLVNVKYFESYFMEDLINNLIGIKRANNIILSENYIDFLPNFLASNTKIKILLLLIVTTH